MLALAATAGAQVDCTDPDNLCTGDPCVIPEIEPANPCVVDFGFREVIIQGLRNVVAVEFRAGLITLAGPVSGRPDMGGRLVLNAQPGDLTLNGTIAFQDESEVELDAWENVSVNAPIRLTGGDDTPLDSVLRIRSLFATVLLDGPIVNLGGADAVEIGASGGIAVMAPIISRRTGEGPQPPLTLGGAGVIIEAPLTLGGSVDIGAEGIIAVRKPIRAAGAHVRIQSSEAIDGVTIDAPIKSTGRANSGRCGAIAIRAGKSLPIINAPVVCAGRAGGDGIALSGNSGVQVNSTLKTVSNDAAGGDIVLTGSAEEFGSVIVTGEILARGSRPGDVIVDGRNVRFEGATVKSSARGGGGAQCYTAVNGAVVLQGEFDAAKGGTIQATATGDVTTDGDFGVGAGGCIGLSAGGVVTTGSSVFDQPVVTSCP